MKPTLDREPWMRTVTGRRFPLLNPTKHDVCLEDIAQALGRLNRFTGHTKVPYVVAQHCVLVALILREWGYDSVLQLCGLFHDGPEAYTGDLSSPMKAAMSLVSAGGMAGHEEVERRVEEAMARKFSLPLDVLHQPCIKKADLVALATEKRDLMEDDGRSPWIELPDPYFHNIEIAMIWAQWLYTHDIQVLLAPAELFKAVFWSLTRDIYTP